MIAVKNIAKIFTKFRIFFFANVGLDKITEIVQLISLLLITLIITLIFHYYMKEGMLRRLDSLSKKLETN